MSDGIHDSQKSSDEAKAQSAIAKAVILFLENPMPPAQKVVEDLIRSILKTTTGGDPDVVLQAVKRLDANDAAEWQRFFHSSAFVSQGDLFKNQFLAVAKKRNIPGF